MTELAALSIRQPWVDLILRGVKTIEVREWLVDRSGPFLIHVAKALDWRSVALFGYREPLDLPRGGILGYAEIAEVIPLTPDVWAENLEMHCVLRARRPRQFGVVLKNVKRFDKIIPCAGRPRFFPIPAHARLETQQALTQVGIVW